MTFNGGLGVHSMWGFSPSMDLLDLHQSKLENRNNANDDEEKGEMDTLNILLVQPSDPRNIIHTLSKRISKAGLCLDEKKAQNLRPINFFILEGQSEVLARHLLLLHVFFDDIPIRHRAALFLEIFGNALVQERTETYISNAASLLRELIYKENRYQGVLKKIINFDHLKQKERDNIAHCLKSWDLENKFDVVSLRDYRLRGYYRDRFDCRERLIDWDYYSRVKEVASIIHIKQFQEWRMSGIAFEFGDATYSSPNRSMSSYTEGRAKSGTEKGMFKDFQGFWLDILVGPYISFGVETDSDCIKAKKLFEVINKGTGAEQHRHHTVEVATYNLIQFMWEIEKHEQYRMKKERDIFSGLGDRSGFIPLKKDDHDKFEKSSNQNNPYGQIPTQDGKTNENPATKVEKDEYIDRTITGVNISLMKGDLSSIMKKKKYLNFFHQIHLSHQSAHFLQSDLKRLTKHDESVREKQQIITVETGKFIFPLNNKERDIMDSKIVEMGKSNGLLPIGIDESQADERHDSNLICFKLCQS